MAGKGSGPRLYRASFHNRAGLIGTTAVYDNHLVESEGDGMGQGLADQPGFIEDRNDDGNRHLDRIVPGLFSAARSWGGTAWDSTLPVWVR